MEATVWEFSCETQDAWRDLGKTATAKRKETRGEGNEDVFLLPYSIAATVLQQYSDGYVHLDRSMRFMVSLNNIPADTLKKVFTYLEGIIRRVPIDEIPFTTTSRTADLIAATTAQRITLAKAIFDTEDGKPTNPPGWAYEAVKWHLARKLSGTPFVDVPVARITETYTDAKGQAKERTIAWQPDDNPEHHAQITYRPASDGSLIAWDHPIGPPFAGRGHPITAQDITRDWPQDPAAGQVQYALSRITVKMATYTALDHPVLNTDAHIRRINNTLIHSRTALVDQGPDRPLLNVTLDGRGLRKANTHALEILAKLSADPTALNAVEDRAHHERTLWNTRDENDERPAILTPPPGPVRPAIPRMPKWFAVGTSPGIYHLELLHKQLQTAFGEDAKMLELHSTGTAFSPRPFEILSAAEKKERKESNTYIDLVGLPSPDSIQKSIENAGYKSLRIVCLWYRDQTRMRMLHGLAHSFGHDPNRLNPKHPNDTVPLAPGIDAVFQHAPGLLAHGPDTTRAADTQTAISPYTDHGVFVAVWCETERPVRSDEHKDMKPAEAKRTLAENDAKHQTRRTLSQRGTPAQYLVGREHDPKKGPRIRTVPRKPYEDHRVYMGLLDLYRSCGIIDDRFEAALYPPGDACPLPRMAWCGIHIRKQATDRRYKGQPRRVITASAIIPSPQPGGAWTLLGWSSLSPQWDHYPRAQARFHALNYPLHKADGDNELQRWTQAAHEVTTALNDLADELDDLPYTLLIDGHACRRVWPGLHNNKQGTQPDEDDPRPWLPSTGLPAHARPASIIRINCAQDELPRLAYVTEQQKNGTERRIKTSSELYQPADPADGHPWFLFTEPRNYGKKRHGQHMTRWRANPGVASASADERRENELNAPWYAMTTREITPLHTQNQYSREALATATARLSHQALSWTDRTRYPAPLHAALQMDLDHPQYRRSAPDDIETSKILENATDDSASSEG
ncbi:RNaseH domain-containing protein [Streptomyces yaizuensis]|uniref:RNaseH domain-containing protein n=2 Tax=Streptomyces yaizuensis TaxID=2989713 RepID=A0ABQ5NYC8_9ACTN|nr:RNaseH domain-containing protein [Streptomyces sp. YSPA8]